MPEALTCALSSVELMKVVGTWMRFHISIDWEVNLVPVTVRVNGGPAAVTDVGDSAASVVDVTVKDSAFELPPTGSSTDTGTLPAAAISAELISALRSVELPDELGKT